MSDNLSAALDFSASRHIVDEIVNNAQAMRAQLNAAEERESVLRSENQALHTQAGLLKIEGERLRAEVERLHAEMSALTMRGQALEGQVENLEGQVETLDGEKQALSAERAELRDKCERQEEDLEARERALHEQHARNSDLSSDLMELYRDLRAEDLPTLILRIGMKLTDSEMGLFANSSGESTMAAIGLDDASTEVSEGIFGYAREALNRDEPIVENDSQKLPDGAGLVNLAALPVAVQGDTRGILLVANKRSGPFTEEDTELLLAIGNHAGIALENSRLHCALADAYVSTIAVLADAIEAKDPYTRGHCESVAQIAVDVAERMGCSGEELDEVRYAALLHDIGKIGIPDGILLKPSRLLPEEFQIIQKHSLIGSDLVGRVPSLSKIAPLILHHHERIDGSGYPDGQCGDEISLASRIICVVDAFDAMTTPRPYRSPVGRVEAVEELRRCAGTHFDPALVEVVAAVLEANAIPNESPVTRQPGNTS
jgi:HD-GYP domain-containing protein (c-di-GMP phosphodiesterase class II)